MEEGKTQKDFAQCGLTQDDTGRMFYSSAGMEQPAYGFQIPRAYGKMRLKGGLTGDFMTPWPIMATPDVQGGPGRLRPDKAFNHFSGSCGQSIFRGDNLPARQFYGLGVGVLLHHLPANAWQIAASSRRMKRDRLQQAG